MIYKRQFQTGFGSDPRRKWYAVYKCEACEHEAWIEMYDPHLFNKEPRRCPECQSFGAEDLRKSLEAKRASLEAQEAQVRAEIEKVIIEIGKLEQKEVYDG